MHVMVQNRVHACNSVVRAHFTVVYLVINHHVPSIVTRSNQSSHQPALWARLSNTSLYIVFGNYRLNFKTLSCNNIIDESDIILTYTIINFDSAFQLPSNATIYGLNLENEVQLTGERTLYSSHNVRILFSGSLIGYLILFPAELVFWCGFTPQLI